MVFFHRARAVTKRQARNEGNGRSVREASRYRILRRYTPRFYAPSMKLALHLRPGPRRRAVLTGGLTLILGACGQTGPLYQPPPPAAEESAQSIDGDAPARRANGMSTRTG